MPIKSRTRSYTQQLNTFIRGNTQSSNTVYCNNNIASLCSSLNSSFPAIKNIISENIFNALCMAYAKNYPSSHWDINIYGQHFPQLLSAQSNNPRAAKYPWLKLGKTALIEYTLCLCYYAKGGEDSEAFSINLEQEANTKLQTNLQASLLTTSDLTILSKAHPLVDLSLNSSNYDHFIYRLKVQRQNYRLSITSA